MANGRSLPPQEDDFALALLRSADADEPPSAAYAKVATALGVSAALGVSVTVPAAAAASVARWPGPLAAKLALLGVSGALLVGAAGAFVRQRVVAGAALSHSAESRLAPVVVFRAPSAQPTVVVVAGAATGGRAIVAAGSATPLTAKPVAALAPPARVSAHTLRLTPAVAHTSSLPEQVQSLDRARVALGAGDSSGALAEIAHYRQAWPNGVFLTEASVLEIEALAKRGEATLAAVHAKAFVEAHPDSPQAERLRALIPVDQP
jgi:hypothetical protein